MVEIPFTWVTTRGVAPIIQVNRTPGEVDER